MVERKKKYKKTIFSSKLAYFTQNGSTENFSEILNPHLKSFRCEEIALHDCWPPWTCRGSRTRNTHNTLHSSKRTTHTKRDSVHFYCTYSARAGFLTKEAAILEWWGVCHGTGPNFFFSFMTTYFLVVALQLHKFEQIGPIKWDRRTFITRMMADLRSPFAIIVLKWNMYDTGKWR